MIISLFDNNDKNINYEAIISHSETFEEAVGEAKVDMSSKDAWERVWLRCKKEDCA